MVRNDSGAQPSMHLFEYYAMMRASLFQQHPLFPNGFEQYHQRTKPKSMTPKGIVASRVWKMLDKVTPTWRRHVNVEQPSLGVFLAFSSGQLRPIVFSDVDFAVIDRDAQGHVDQYVADRATLEALGFVAKYYEELRDPHKRLDDIKGNASEDLCFELGQTLFYSILEKLKHQKDLRIPLHKAEAFVELLQKQPNELTNEDYVDALSWVEDSFYTLIVNPLAEHISSTGISAHGQADSHAGPNRMQLIYTTIAAYSHSQMPDDEKVRQKLFGDFDARKHLFPGVPEFFAAIQEQGVDVVAVTRGNQWPYMEKSKSGINEMFDRVYATMIASDRSQSYLDPLHPDKKIRSYSMAIDNMSTVDKIRIMLHESLEQFSRAGLEFKNEEEIVSALAFYLDHCIFITDADLEVWATCPTIAVLGPRTPTAKAVKETFGALLDQPVPIAIINPSARKESLHGLREKDVFPDFNPQQEGLKTLIEDLGSGREIRMIYSAAPGLTR